MESYSTDARLRKKVEENKGNEEGKKKGKKTKKARRGKKVWQLRY